ncbi:hypothetical protein QP166_03885 [Sphingomonas sp. LR60]|uniref:hypothetical protein n=1 Tax=Sphingomonas sp. LR60 TaxID=3050233 RepID=UPI002FE0A76C
MIAQVAIAATRFLHQINGTRCAAAKQFREALMLYLVYLIAQYRNQTRARAIAANDTDTRRAA